MNPKLRVEIKLFIEGDPVPEFEGFIRVPWPEDLTLQAAMEQAAERACREIHLPKPVMRFA